MKDFRFFRDFVADKFFIVRSLPSIGEVPFWSIWYPSHSTSEHRNWHLLSLTDILASSNRFSVLSTASMCSSAVPTVTMRMSSIKA